MLKKTLTIFWVISLVFFVFSISVCTETTFKISKTMVTMRIGETCQLKTNSKTPVKWTTNDKATAVVSSEGKITGISPGTVTITATAGNQKAKCTVTVKPVARVTMNIGESRKLKANLKTTIKWSTDNKGTVTLNREGKITAISPGSATITATVNGRIVKCIVTVIGQGTDLDKFTLVKVKRHINKIMGFDLPESAKFFNLEIHPNILYEAEDDLYRSGEVYRDEDTVYAKIHLNSKDFNMISENLKINRPWWDFNVISDESKRTANYIKSFLPWWNLNVDEIVLAGQRYESFDLEYKDWEISFDMEANIFITNNKNGQYYLYYSFYQ